jgi:hypothetical protein
MTRKEDREALLKAIEEGRRGGTVVAKKKATMKMSTKKKVVTEATAKKKGNKYKFIFEETFTSGSRRKILVYDIESTEDWQLLIEEAVEMAQLDSFDWSTLDINKPSQEPNDWLGLLEECDQGKWLDGEEEGDEPDERYWDNGPEDQRFYFEKAK